MMKSFFGPSFTLISISYCYAENRIMSVVALENKTNLNLSNLQHKIILHLFGNWISEYRMYIC